MCLNIGVDLLFQDLRTLLIYNIVICCTAAFLTSQRPEALPLGAALAMRKRRAHPTMKPPEPTDVKVNPSCAGVNDDPVSRTWVMVSAVDSPRLARVMISLA